MLGIFIHPILHLPAFLTHKVDVNEISRWVNDYRILNVNTVLDSHPLPCVDDILADCVKGQVWRKIEMTNLFFKTRVHLDAVHLMAINTPLCLYKWLAMPMGLKKTPPIHQQRVNMAL